MCWCCVFMNVLTIFMVEEFYIYAVVQFYFFSARKSVMYEINQSHLFENKIFILNFIKSNAVPHRLVLNVVHSANPCSNICNNCQEYSALVDLVSVRLKQRTIKE